MHGEGSPSYYTKWADDSNRRWESREDDPRSGLPVHVTDPQNCCPCRDINRGWSVSCSPKHPQKFHFSQGSVSTFDNEHLMPEVSPRRSHSKPCAEDPQQRLDFVSRAFQTTQSAPSRLITRAVIDGENELESKQCGSTRDHQHRIYFTPSTQPTRSCGRFFWDARGILLIDYFPQKTTIAGE